MTVIVDLIETLTGRQVVLVPPSAYLVSSPSPPPHGRPSVELVVPPDLVSEQQSGADGLEIDITSVLERGVSERMILARSARGGLELSPALNLAI
jgi:hypothetical protein